MKWKFIYEKDLPQSSEKENDAGAQLWLYWTDDVVFKSAILKKQKLKY